MHSKPLYKAVAFCTTAFLFIGLSAQDDTTSSMLDEDPVKSEKVQNSFKTTKVINLQSVEVTDAGVFDFKINHRFGPVNSGAYNMFGLDAASVRIGGEYGVIPNLMVGAGRSSIEKTVDGYFKYRMMHQTSDNKKPLGILLFGGVAYRNVNFTFPVTSMERLAYTAQLILGRKFSENFSLVVSPSLVHYNLGKNEFSNTQYALGLGMRQKLTKRTTLNLEYIPVFGEHGSYHNSISVGFDIETGGHVFQLHFTNSTGNNESNFIARTDGDWKTGGVRFGFNISRVFTFVDPSRFKNNSY
ncbi:MAG: hypothetical protein KG003_09410 [Bacteroidetes bacterium]|nr:hypothetical protein [Bacteroidota bacterium]